MILKITFFPFPISNHDAIRNIKNLKKFILNNYFKMVLKTFKIIIVFGNFKSP